MQCTIYMTTPYPGLIQELQYKVTYVLVERDGHAVYYINDSSLSWLDTITSVVSSLYLSGMRQSCSALYI
jgi:hypothetical protein